MILLNDTDCIDMTPVDENNILAGENTIPAGGNVISADKNDVLAVQSLDVIIYTIAIGIAILIVVPTSWLFYRLRLRAGIRFRSPAITLMATCIGGLGFCELAIRTMFMEDLPCWLHMWAMYLVIPAYLTLICCRTLHLVGWYRIGEAHAAMTNFAGNMTTSISAENVDQDNCSMNHSGEKSSPISRSNTVRTHHTNKYTPTIHVAPSDIGSLEQGYKQSQASRVALWFLHHQHYIRTGFLVRISLISIAIFAAFAAIVHLLSEDMSFSGDPQGSAANCTAGWVVIPLLSITLIQIFIMLPICILLLRGARDVCGILSELVLLFATLASSYICYVVLFMVLGSSSPFPPANILMISFLLAHLLIVIRPLWLTSKETRQHHAPNIMDDADTQSVLAYDYDKRSEISELTATGTALNHPARAHFRALLNNSETFSKFEDFAVRNLCVENVHFYGSCIGILRYAEALQRYTRQNAENQSTSEENRQSTSPTMLPKDISVDGLNHKLKWLGETYLLETSDLQVNLKDGTRRKLLAMIDGGADAFDASVLREALHEVEVLMFFDTYQRYLRYMQSNNTEGWFKRLYNRITSKVNGSGSHSPERRKTVITLG